MHDGSYLATQTRGSLGGDMNTLKTATFGLALFLSGCATTPPAPPVPFDATGLEWAKGKGNNSVSGDAVLRTRGGDVKTCAGLDVKLLPVSDYTRAMAARHYGAGDSGYLDRGYVFVSPPAWATEMEPYVRRKRCNAQGQFSFTDLPEGDYYVIATVIWEAPTGGRYSYMATQGGDLLQKITLRAGASENITLSR